MINFSEHTEDFSISVTQQGLAPGVVVRDGSHVDVTNIAASISGPAVIYMTVHAVPGSHVLQRRDIEIHTTLPYYISTHNSQKVSELLGQQQSRNKRLAIFGTAGSGKTVLAKSYLQAYETAYAGHLTKILVAERLEDWHGALRDWAESLDSFLCEKLKEEKDPDRQKRLIIKSIKMALNDTPWCVVIDNWDSQTGPEIGELEGLFNIGQGTWIITTQHQPPFADPLCSLDLSSGMSEKESVTLLDKVLQPLGEDINKLGGIEEKRSLIIALNHLPLALVQAGSYLLWENIEKRKTRNVFTYQAYENLLKIKVSELIAVQTKRLGIRADVPREPESIHSEFIRLKTQEAAVSLSLKKVLKSDSSEPQIHIWRALIFFGFIFGQNIPLELLKIYMNLSYIDEDKENNKYFEETLTDTQNYSLLQFEKESSSNEIPCLYIHRVTQKVIRDIYWPNFLEKTEAFRGMREFDITLMIESLRRTFEEAIKKENYKAIKIYQLHTDSWIHWSKMLVSLSQASTSSINLLGDLAHIDQLMGNYHQAKEQLTNVLEMKIQLYKSEHHPDVAITQHNLGKVLQFLGDYAEAEKQYLKALKTAQKYPNDVSVESIKMDLGFTQQCLGRYSEAKVLLNEAFLETERKGDPVAIAMIQQDTAGILMKNKDAISRQKAVEMYRKARLIIENNFDKDHIQVAKVQENLAASLMNMGDEEFYNESRDLCENSLRIKKTHYSPNGQHIDIAIAKQNLASILAKLSCYHEALTLFEESIQVKTSFYGENHIEVAFLKINFAYLLMEMKEFHQALEIINASENTLQEKVGGKQYLEHCRQLKQKILEKGNEEVGKEMLSSLKDNIHTLFSQGYRFSVERKGEDKLRIQAVKFSGENAELRAVKSELVKQFSRHFEKPVIKYDDRGDVCLIKGSAFFVNRIMEKFSAIARENREHCIIS